MGDKTNEIRRREAFEIVAGGQTKSLIWSIAFATAALFSLIVDIKFMPWTIFTIGFTLTSIISILRFYSLKEAKSVVLNGKVTEGTCYYHNDLPGQIVDEWVFKDHEKNANVQFAFKTHSNIFESVTRSSSLHLPKLIIKHDDVIVFWMYKKVWFIPKVLKVYAYFPQYTNFTKLKITKQYRPVFIDED